MVTDTAFYRYAYYHTALDTPDRLNYIAMAEVTRGLARAVAYLAVRGFLFQARSQRKAMAQKRQMSAELRKNL